MISVDRMAEVVAKRLRRDRDTIARLRAELVAIKINRPAVKGRPRKPPVMVGGLEIVRARLDVLDVDFGDGKPVRASLILRGDFFVVRRWKSRHVWTVPVRDAIGVLARRGQMRAVNARLGVRG